MHPAAHSSGNTLRRIVLIAPLPALLLLAYAIPFLGVASWSVSLPQWGLSHYVALGTDPLVLSVLARTLRICLTVTVASVAIAYVLAFVWVRGTPRQSLVVEFCVLVPFWISVLTRAFGWVALLSNKGLLNTWAQSLGLIDEPLALVRNELGVVIGMTHYLVSFAVVPLASTLRQVDDRVLMAARGLGASRTRIFWSVLLPMTIPGIIGATLLVFVFSLGFFITPAILGGGRSVMIAELVYVRIFQSPDWGLAAAISVAMVMIVAIAMWAFLKIAKPQALVR
jgi:putative spermidine/putrescine transport system permease protein